MEISRMMRTFGEVPFGWWEIWRECLNDWSLTGGFVCTVSPFWRCVQIGLTFCESASGTWVWVFAHSVCRSSSCLLGPRILCLLRLVSNEGSARRIRLRWSYVDHPLLIEILFELSKMTGNCFIKNDISRDCNSWTTSSSLLNGTDLKRYFRLPTSPTVVLRWSTLWPTQPRSCRSSVREVDSMQLKCPEIGHVISWNLSTNVNGTAETSSETLWRQTPVYMKFGWFPSENIGKGNHHNVDQASCVWCFKHDKKPLWFSSLPEHR
jgi:hypothetical protein